MVGMLGWGARVGSSLWPALLDHLWQATLFSILVLLLTFAVRRAPARLRHSLFLFASLKFLLPSALLAAAAVWLRADLPLLAGGLDRAVGGLLEPFWSPAAFSGYLRLVELPILGLALGVLWVAGSLFLLISWARQHRELARKLRAAPQADDPRVLAALETAHSRLALTRPIKAVVSSEPPIPAVWGIFRPVLTLPPDLATELSQEELELVALHELVHVRRWDNLVSTAQRLLCAAFWFHPLIWLLERRLGEEREQACDEQVVLFSGGVEVYRRTLLKVVRFGLGRPVAGLSSMSSSCLGRRLARLDRLSVVPPRQPSPLAERGFLALAAAFFVLSSIASSARPMGVPEPAVRAPVAKPSPCPEAGSRAAIESRSRVRIQWSAETKKATGRGTIPPARCIGAPRSLGC